MEKISLDTLQENFLCVVQKKQSERSLETT